MGIELKSIVKKLMGRTPYRIVRDSPPNGFQAIEFCLRSLKDRGFSPSVVIDGGAHLGSFSLTGKTIFPQAKFHLVEPQLACAASLKLLCARHGFVLHECALADRAGNVFLLKTDLPGTGAYIKPEPDADSIAVTACTLDSLFITWVAPDDRVLLKMDLQGYELHALRGARSAMKSVEVILTEVSFYAQAYEPSILDLLVFLNENEFQLYDIAALFRRQRDDRLHQGDFVFVRRGSRLLEDKRWD